MKKMMLVYFSALCVVGLSSAQSNHGLRVGGVVSAQKTEFLPHLATVLHMAVAMDKSSETPLLGANACNIIDCSVSAQQRDTSWMPAGGYFSSDAFVSSKVDQREVHQGGGVRWETDTQHQSSEHDFEQTSKNHTSEPETSSLGVFGALTGAWWLAAKKKTFSIIKLCERGVFIAAHVKSVGKVSLGQLKDNIHSAVSGRYQRLTDFAKHAKDAICNGAKEVVDHELGRVQRVADKVGDFVETVENAAKNITRVSNALHSAYHGARKVGKVACLAGATLGAAKLGVAFHSQAVRVGVTTVVAGAAAGDAIAKMGAGSFGSAVGQLGLSLSQTAPMVM